MTVLSEDGTVQVGGRTVVRAEVEDFLYEEAAILDAWAYDTWLTLFEEGARFEIPTTDYQPSGHWSIHGAGSFVDDDWGLLKARVKRLKSRKAHAENPPSRTHRMISNVRLFEHDAQTLRVAASFIVHRARDGQFDTYVGRYDHLLVPAPEGLRFRIRRTILTHEALPPGARLSFIL
jgi:p-cumate 2,3-dioxygenase beta subunit